MFNISGYLVIDLGKMKERGIREKGARGCIMKHLSTDQTKNRQKERQLPNLLQKIISACIFVVNVSMIYEDRDISSVCTESFRRES